jgi:hypothetical protein
MKTLKKWMAHLPTDMLNSPYIATNRLYRCTPEENRASAAGGDRYLGTFRFPDGEYVVMLSLAPLGHHPLMAREDNQ